MSKSSSNQSSQFKVRQSVILPPVLMSGLNTKNEGEKEKKTSVTPTLPPTIRDTAKSFKFSRTAAKETHQGFGRQQAEEEPSSPYEHLGMKRVLQEEESYEEEHDKSSCLSEYQNNSIVIMPSRRSFNENDELDQTESRVADHTLQRPF